MQLIPLDKLPFYMELHTSEYFCEHCHKQNESILIPYAYDEENNDVIFVGKCNYCGTINLFKE